MNRVSIYQIPATSDVLSSAVSSPSVPPALVEPMQSMVAAIAHRATESPVRVYVCAEDALALARDGFATALARSMSAHVPSSVVVDCDFLRIGLSGLVPQPDALGLLDYLLYGSSIGVVTQEAAGGLRVVGAGSFPVTRRMPFVASAFDDAAQRLASHSRCAIFVGPLLQEDGTAHPLASRANVTIVVRGDEGARAPRGGVNAIEEIIATDGVDVWSVRAGAPEPKPARPVDTPRPASRPAAPAAARPKPAAAVAPEAARPRPRGAEALEPPESRYSSLAPRIALLVFALFVIAFVAWWWWQGRSQPGAGEEAAPAAVDTPAETVPVPVHADTLAVATVDSAAVSTPDSARASAPPATPPVRPEDTAGRTGGTVLVDPSDILVMADLESRWKDWYAIHISSFQESIRAREEVSFLQSREFPVFIVFLDLGAKGKWYRVYAGPFRTREEARDVKKNLDAIAQVRFTRITKIPE
ncbi:MAG TPA: SPOR domain-containing protein [Candidatus Krumholzibacteria bacterium]|nr:SPOR domain-containing protein [Candidatus Krumholzibacteria bacterium]